MTNSKWEMQGQSFSCVHFLSTNVPCKYKCTWTLFFCHPIAEIGGREAGNWSSMEANADWFPNKMFLMDSHCSLPLLECQACEGDTMLQQPHGVGATRLVLLSADESYGFTLGWLSDNNFIKVPQWIKFFFLHFRQILIQFYSQAIIKNSNYK